MYKGILIGIVLVSAGLAGWFSSPADGQSGGVAPAAGQSAPQQAPPPGLPPVGETKPAPTIPQEYFPTLTPSNAPAGNLMPPLSPRAADAKIPTLVSPTQASTGLQPVDKPAPLDRNPRLTQATELKPGQPAAGVTGAADQPAIEEASTQNNDNPTGRQEPSVSLEWIGPPTAKLGQPVTYQIIVKNTSTSPVHNLAVRNRIPAGVTVQATEPRALTELNMLVWELGTLQPRQEKRLDLQLLPEMRGDLACQAFVSFTGSSVARIKVREPKLVIKATGPEKALLGDTVPLSLTVTNPGDGSADQVKVRAILSEGLDHSRGRTIDFDLGNLGPNETRSVQLVCTAKTGGAQTCEAAAVAEGGLKASDVISLEVILPRLEVTLAGPRLRYLDRKATFVVKVVNPGSAPASNVVVSDVIPDGFKFLSANEGGRHDFATRTVSWYLGDLTPGQAREMSMELLAINVGDHSQKATVSAARGLKSEAEVVTHIEGLSALLMELVDLDDPVEVGAETAYEVRVTNTGSKTETNLQLVCTIPDKMEFRGAQGASGVHARLQGRELIFEPIAKLAPRADAIFRINVRGVAPGDLRFRARITADGLTEPVLKEESTKVYGDDAVK